MKGEHVPQVGDWVHNDAMPGGDIYVKRFDGSMFWGRIWWRDLARLSGLDSLHPLDSAYGWHRVDPPTEIPVYPEVWISVWRNGCGRGWPDRVGLLAAINALDPHHEDILGIIHLHPDGTTTLEPLEATP